MIHFDKIVMSENEPTMKRGVLWIKREKQVPYSTDSKKPMSKSLGFWYYGNNGWESILDFDTNYILDSHTHNEATDNPVVIGKSKSANYNGDVKLTLDFSLYEGDRTIGNNGNLVTEQGLNTQVDALNVKINQLLDVINGMSTTIQSLSNRITALENN